jgi:nucleotide-binding universal stress UspA family protein
MLQILVPTDFSNNSYNALFYAAKLFKNKKSTFHIVNVCSTKNDPKKEEAQLESAQGLDALVHRLIRDVGENLNHDYKKISLCSDLSEGIADYAKTNKVDLTVIGNKAQEEVKHILFGNNAMQLVREITHCPVLIVPLEIDFKKVDKLAFTSNYTYPIAEENSKAIIFFSELMDSVVVPMRIQENKGNDTAEKNRTQFLNAIAHKSGKEVELPIFDGKVNTILEFVDLWKIGMLCMVYYPHHFFLEFIGNGIIKELNTKLKVPFLILPNRQS